MSLRDNYIEMRWIKQNITYYIIILVFHMKQNGSFTEFMVVIQCCQNCAHHSWCSRHDEVKYDEHFTELKRKIEDQLPQVRVTKNQLPAAFKRLNNRFMEDNRFLNEKTGDIVQYPRLGAFEIYCDGYLVFSKIQSNLWPCHNRMVALIYSMHHDKKNNKDLAKYSLENRIYHQNDEIFKITYNRMIQKQFQKQETWGKPSRINSSLQRSNLANSNVKLELTPQLKKGIKIRKIASSSRKKIEPLSYSHVQAVRRAEDFGNLEVGYDGKRSLGNNKYIRPIQKHKKQYQEVIKSRKKGDPNEDTWTNEEKQQSKHLEEDHIEKVKKPSVRIIRKVIDTKIDQKRARPEETEKKIPRIQPIKIFPHDNEKQVGSPIKQYDQDDYEQLYDEEQQKEKKKKELEVDEYAEEFQDDRKSGDQSGMKASIRSQSIREDMKNSSDMKRSGNVEEIIEQDFEMGYLKKSEKGKNVKKRGDEGDIEEIMEGIDESVDDDGEKEKELAREKQRKQKQRKAAEQRERQLQAKIEKERVEEQRVREIEREKEREAQRQRDIQMERDRQQKLLEEQKERERERQRQLEKEKEKEREREEERIRQINRAEKEEQSRLNLIEQQKRLQQELIEEEQRKEKERLTELENTLKEQEIREAEEKRLKEQEEKRENEQREKQRVEQEKVEKQRVESLKLEQERVEKQRVEQEKVEQERLEQERLEKQRVENLRIEQERVQHEKQEKQRVEQQRIRQQELEVLEAKKKEEDEHKELEERQHLEMMEKTEHPQVSEIAATAHPAEEVEQSVSHLHDAPKPQQQPQHPIQQDPIQVPQKLKSEPAINDQIPQPPIDPPQQIIQPPLQEPKPLPDQVEEEIPTERWMSKFSNSRYVIFNLDSTEVEYVNENQPVYKVSLPSYEPEPVSQTKLEEKGSGEQVVQQGLKEQAHPVEQRVNESVPQETKQEPKQEPVQDNNKVEQPEPINEPVHQKQQYWVSRVSEGRFSLTHSDEPHQPFSYPEVEKKEEQVIQNHPESDTLIAQSHPTKVGETVGETEEKLEEKEEDVPEKTGQKVEERVQETHVPVVETVHWVSKPIDNQFVLTSVPQHTTHQFTEVIRTNTNPSEQVKELKTHQPVEQVKQEQAKLQNEQQAKAEQVEYADNFQQEVEEKQKKEQIPDSNINQPLFEPVVEDLYWISNFGNSYSSLQKVTKEDYDSHRQSFNEKIAQTVNDTQPPASTPILQLVVDGVAETLHKQNQENQEPIQTIKILSSQPNLSPEPWTGNIRPIDSVYQIPDQINIENTLFWESKIVDGEFSTTKVIKQVVENYLSTLLSPSQIGAVESVTVIEESHVMHSKQETVSNQESAQSIQTQLKQDEVIPVKVDVKQVSYNLIDSEGQIQERVQETEIVIEYESPKKQEGEIEHPQLKQEPEAEKEEIPDVLKNIDSDSVGWRSKFHEGEWMMVKASE